MFYHTDLHRHNFKQLADFFADGVFTAAAGASQFMLGKFVDDLRNSAFSSLIGSRRAWGTDALFRLWHRDAS
jgi:hypothetical protein